MNAVTMREGRERMGMHAAFRTEPERSLALLRTTGGEDFVPALLS